MGSLMWPVLWLMVSGGETMDMDYIDGNQNTQLR